MKKESFFYEKLTYTIHTMLLDAIIYSSGIIENKKCMNNYYLVLLSQSFFFQVKVVCETRDFTHSMELKDLLMSRYTKVKFDNTHRERDLNNEY